MPPYLVLARKYRPSIFSDVVGQDHVIKTLANSIISGRVGHAFLFCGVRGVGKTTVARILAKSLNCTGRSDNDANPCNQCTSCKEIAAGISVDVQEIDGASNTSVENVREINENIKYPPAGSRFKIIIIDEVHMISINAFNALLKTLEEPPLHAKFIFATTESHKVPATINSRCQRYNFRTISIQEISSGLTAIMGKEGLQAEPEALTLVAREARGSFRDALSLLDQVIAFSSGVINVAEVTSILGISGRESFAGLVEAVIERDPKRAFEVINAVFREGYDPEQFFLDITQYVRDLAVVKAMPGENRPAGLIDAPVAEIQRMEEICRSAGLEEFQNIFATLVKSESEIKRASNPITALEMLVLKLAHAPRIMDLAKLLKFIESGDLPEPPQPIRGTRASPAEEKKRPFGSQNQEDEALNKPAVPDSGFRITQITPLASNDPEEIWSNLKGKLTQMGEHMAAQLLEHGALLSAGPDEIELGFHKAVYKNSFETILESRDSVRQTFEDLFGCISIKLLVLTEQTPLKVEASYKDEPDGTTDYKRALLKQALENSVVNAVLNEFEGSHIEDVVVLDPQRPRKKTEFAVDNS